MSLQTTITTNGSYGFTTNLEDGLMLVVLSQDDKTVSGVKILPKGNENFSMEKHKFFSLLDCKTLDFIEILPRFVIKDLKKIHKKNLQ